MKTESLVLPHEPGWQEARRAWNLAVDQRPAAVALPETAAEVAAVVRWARSRGLRVAPQGTGHAADAMGSLAHTVLVKTERMRGIEIDPEARRARVEAGVLWDEVTEAAAKHGLAALAGSSPDVGVVGYTLGGGLSWLARRHGLASNSVTAVELVNAEGEHVRADPENEPELFWALRGGGGSFGIVTALEFELYPIREIYAGVLFFPAERGTEILRAWRRWIETVPDELTTVGRFLHFPPLPELPEHLRGGSFVVVEAVYLGDEQSGADLLRPMRELGPVMDTVATIPVERLSTVHMDPEHPVPGAGDGMLLSDFPDEAIDALVAVAGADSGSPLLSVEVRHLEGALARSRPGQGALGTLEARFAMIAVGIAATPAMGAAVRAHVEFLQSGLARWDSGRDYLNFTTRRERGQRFFGARAFAGLQAVKAKVDPQDVFRSNHPIRVPARRLRRAA
jgi:FAD binding domain/Berberine and berberine like